MPFKKGKSGNPNGRRKGVSNKSTELARLAIAEFVDNNTQRLGDLITSIEKEHGSLEAFKCIVSLIEYHVPKLARTEVEKRVVDKNGDDIHERDMQILRDAGFVLERTKKSDR